MKQKTIDDIALEAGVSKATVSRVLSHPELVSEKTSLKVLTVMEKYSYIPNHLAQGLAGTATKTIGVVIDELSNFFFIEIAEGIDFVLDSQEYSMLISSSRWVEQRETRLVSSLISSRVDGVLLAPVSAHPKAVELLQRANIPFVLINCIPEDKNISFVSSDNHEGGRIAAQFINTHPREQTIIITGFSHQSIEHRLEGFHDTIDPQVSLKHYSQIKTQEEGYALVPHLISEDSIQRIPTTLFVTNDNVAIGIINRLVELKIPIPDQVSILGYDNIRIASSCRVPLTTISQSSVEMGRVATKMLLHLIKNKEKPEVLTHLIKPELICRESSD
ncbi:MAG: LacI family DNA-binding transcriptional regulator [Sphaerochaeta sp.]|nr:LacI family DNA-binding transcriptional regulator [Sphaerochaeta sp.]